MNTRAGRKQSTNRTARMLPLFPVPFYQCPPGNPSFFQNSYNGGIFQNCATPGPMACPCMVPNANDSMNQTNMQTKKRTSSRRKNAQPIAPNIPADIAPSTNLPPPQPEAPQAFQNQSSKQEPAFDSSQYQPIIEDEFVCYDSLNPNPLQDDVISEQFEEYLENTITEK